MTLRGRLDAAAAAIVNQLLADLVVGQGNGAVVVDTSDVMDVKAVKGILAEVASVASVRGAKFAVVGVSLDSYAGQP